MTRFSRSATIQSFCPGNQILEKLADQLLTGFVRVVAVGVELLVCFGNHDLRLVHGIHVQKDETLPEHVLSAGAAKDSHSRAHYGYGLVIPGVVTIRARSPVDGVFQNAGNAVVVFGSDEQNGIGGADAFLEIDDNRRRGLLLVLIEQGNAIEFEDFDLRAIGSELLRGAQGHAVERTSSQASSNAENGEWGVHDRSSLSIDEISQSRLRLVLIPRCVHSISGKLAVVMRVHVVFFGTMKDAAGKSRDTLDLPEGVSVREVLAHYQARIPGIEGLLPSLAVAVNQRYASADAKLKADDEVALLPPVSGGADGNEPAARRSEVDQSNLLRCCSIMRDRIDTGRVLAGIKRGEDGAAVVFEGVVRNQTRGRRTVYLEYEAYEAMALRQLEELAEKALKQFAIRDVRIVHRLGRIEIGETSVLIVVASAHRAAAFDACRWLIDTLKRTVPIWKKEYFVDGAVWADGEPFPEEILRGSCARSGSPIKRDASK